MARLVSLISYAIFLAQGQGLLSLTDEALRLEKFGQLIEAAPVAVITLSLENSFDLIPASVLAQAIDIATRFYAGLGVRLQWRLGNAKRGAAKTDCSRRAIEIRIEFTTDIPNGVSDTTLARTFAYNMQESRIQVLTNRFQLLHRYRPRLSGPLLGNVLAHEIAHVLQRIDRHSKSGLMRAHWSEVDHEQMQNGALKFELSDVELIHLGVESRLRSCSTQAMR